MTARSFIRKNQDHVRRGLSSFDGQVRRSENRSGRRHRAAIGISERSDALTIVVSEEDGEHRVTIDGNIILKLTLERLEELLDRYLILK